MNNFIDNVLHQNIINVLDQYGFTGRCYFVGGSIRDYLLNLELNDYDIAVEKITQSEVDHLLSTLKLTGEDFPVFRFRVPDSNQVIHEIELAVARTERSTGPGYNDFAVEYGHSVSIYDDLRRRDLTINAMAINVTNLDILIDPFNGFDDLNNRVIRHTSEAFSEDPLRVFRVARFASRFEDFFVHGSTAALCESLNEDTRALVGERVGIEVEKMFKSARRPSIFFKFLKETNNLYIWFPELNNMIGVPQPEKYHGKNDVFDHTMETIDNARRFTDNVEILFATLFHDVGKTLTPDDILPAHHGHENTGTALVDDIVDRLRLNNNIKRTLFDSIKNHMKIGRTLEMRNKTILKMVQSLKRNNTFHNVIAVSHADRLRDGGLSCDTIRKLHYAEFALSEKLPASVVASLADKNGLQCNQIVQSFRVRRFNELF